MTARFFGAHSYPYLPRGAIAVVRQLVDQRTSCDSSLQCDCLEAGGDGWFVSRSAWSRGKVSAMHLASDSVSGIIASGDCTASTRVCPRRKIPPPSVLDGRAGGRSPSEVPSTSDS
jgi:hypothetical protein